MFCPPLQYMYVRRYEMSAFLKNKSSCYVRCYEMSAFLLKILFSLVHLFKMSAKNIDVCILQQICTV